MLNTEAKPDAVMKIVFPTSPGNPLAICHDSFPFAFYCSFFDCQSWTPPQIAKRFKGTHFLIQEWHLFKTNFEKCRPSHQLTWNSNIKTDTQTPKNGAKKNDPISQSRDAHKVAKFSKIYDDSTLSPDQLFPIFFEPLTFSKRSRLITVEGKFFVYWADICGNFARFKILSKSSLFAGNCFNFFILYPIRRLKILFLWIFYRNSDIRHNLVGYNISFPVFAVLPSRHIKH